MKFATIVSSRAIIGKTVSCGAKNIGNRAASNVAFSGLSP
jgi:hypothetical protein